MALHDTMLSRILEWPRSVKRLIVVALDTGMGLLAMWLAFTLRLEALHRPEGLQWLVYALGPLLAFPIFVNQGLYRAIFRYTGIRALITTGKAVTLYGALLLAVLLVAKWEGVPRSVGILQPLMFLLLVGASRALGWLWLAGSPGKEPRRLQRCAGVRPAGPARRGAAPGRDRRAACRAQHHAPAATPDHREPE